MPKIDPPYQATIVADIRAQIADGRLQPGDDLPTVEALADDYGVSPGTVRLALGKLKRDGILVGYQGIGHRVPKATP
jgi:DNA-binding GntR family transcriptional regulator